MELWNEYVDELEGLLNEGKLNLTGKEFLKAIKRLIIPFKINFKKFMENQHVYTEDQTSALLGKAGSKSLQTIIEFHSVAMGFDTFFISAFPDVYLWQRDNYENNKKLVSLLDDFEIYKHLYLRQDEKLSVMYYEKLCEIYKSENNKFELSIQD